MITDDHGKGYGGMGHLWVIALICCCLLVFLWGHRNQPAPEKAPLSTAVKAPPPRIDAPVENNTRVDVEHPNRSPIEEPANGHVTSSACLECHEHEHRSWHASYHRTMTQVAKPETVLGDFDNITYRFADGSKFRLGRDGRNYWVEIANHPQCPPGSDGGGLRLPIVLATGSHHMQVYWFGMGRGQNLGILPLVHLRGENRWIPRDAAFIQPPTASPDLELGRWNHTCNTCHTTDPRPNWLDDERHFDTRVSEFGISCEACHGPGEAHITHHRNTSSTPPNAEMDPIVNPASLDHVKSTQVCGACHVAHHRVDPHGRYTPFVPGGDYAKARLPLRFEEEFIEKLLAGKTNLVETREEIVQQAQSQFWPDGAVRVAGREYNGLLSSPCHTVGEMSCISCHSLHQGRSDERTAKEWADDLMKPERMGNRACLQCHESANYDSPAHTHHSPESSGSLCYNCHMPHTSYGLLKAVRSHTIDSPRVMVGKRAGRPNACNLCHLDQTLEWTSDHLHKWYGMSKPALAREQRETASGPLWLLKGDARLRALIAWHLGWQPAVEASDSDWMPPYLSILMEDPYQAVRAITSRSLQQLSPPPSLKYDFLARAEDRRRASTDLIAWWKQTRSSPWKHRPRILIDLQGNMETNRVQTLLQNRDNRPVAISE